MNKLEGVSRNILVDRVPLIVDRINKLNERLKASGAPLVEIEIGKQRLVNSSSDPMVKGTNLTMCDVLIKRDIKGPGGDIRLLAKTSIDPTSRFMSHEFYAKLDDEQVDLLENPLHPCHCDHCGTQRNRVVMFAFENDEGIFRVGSGCADDFAGMQIKKWTEAVAKAIDEVEQQSHLNTGDLIRHSVFSVEDFLRESAMIVGMMGYGSAKTHGSNSTGHLAFENIQIKTANAADFNTCYPAEIVEKARMIIEYIAESEFRPEDKNNDYFVNLRNLVKLGYMTSSQLSILASAVSAYDNYENKKAVINENQSSFIGHVGTIGDRALLKDLLVDSVYKDYDGMYPSTRIVYVDEDKNMLVWKRSGIHEDMAKEGEKVTLVGRIDAHNNWFSKKYGKEVSETKLTRCVIMSPEDVLEFEEKEAKKAEKIAKKQAKLKSGESSPSP